MTRIYLVRHGQTEWNSQHRMQGRQDSPLTELGRSQAEGAASELAGISFAAAYCSPAQRAVKTAAIILENHKQRAEIFDAFAEIALGSWEGASYDNDNTTKDVQRHNFWFSPDKYDPAGNGGESFHEVLDRALNGIKNILNLNKDADNILVVAHTVTIRSILNYLIERPLSNFWHDPKMAPCSISIVDAELVAGKFSAEVISYAGTDCDCATL